MTPRLSSTETVYSSEECRPGRCTGVNALRSSGEEWNLLVFNRGRSSLEPPRTRAEGERRVWQVCTMRKDRKRAGGRWTIWKKKKSYMLYSQDTHSSKEPTVLDQGQVYSYPHETKSQRKILPRYISVCFHWFHFDGTIDIRSDHSDRVLLV